MGDPGAGKHNSGNILSGYFLPESLTGSGFWRPAPIGNKLYELGEQGIRSRLNAEYQRLSTDFSAIVSPYLDIFHPIEP
jgi:hypothetical protein